MEKTLACGDVVAGCNAVLTGKDDNEVMQKAAAHAKQAHNMASIPPDVAARVRAAIKEKRS